MGEKHPNRKKDKYNPYTLIILDGRYYLSFKDSRGELQTIELMRCCMACLTALSLRIYHISTS